MKSNLALIGMPGAGKSTVGIILAKTLAKGFVDTDILIQQNCGRSLQAILDSAGYGALRRAEEEEILRLNVIDHVIATGGSAVYSATAMTHLATASTIIFLQVDFDEIVRRIHNFDTRGIARSATQSFRELYAERQILYRRYAQLTIDCAGLNQEAIVAKIATAYAQQ
ncbi:MAG: shikimate kinase [Desulfuromonadaceae bacterium]|nr:shikimate kinase [Desulfuromonadaceae bacterium]